MVVAVAVALAVAVTIVVVRAAVAAAVGVESPAAVTAGRGGNREVEAVVSGQTPDGETAGEDGTTAPLCRGAPEHATRAEGAGALIISRRVVGAGGGAHDRPVRCRTPASEFN